MEIIGVTPGGGRASQRTSCFVSASNFHRIALYKNSKTVTFLEVIEPFPGLASDIADRLLDRRKTKGVMKEHTRRVPRAPQTAIECVEVGVNDIDMNQIVRALISVDPLPIVATSQSNVLVAGEAVRREREDIAFVSGVFVSTKCVDPNDAVEKTGKGNGGVSIFHTEFEAASSANVESVNQIAEYALNSLPRSRRLENSRRELAMPRDVGFNRNTRSHHSRKNRLPIFEFGNHKISK
jgi:hypothetical protein